jgi:hypothetical protein
MGMFSRWLDGTAQRHFAKDQSGRMVFIDRGLARGQRHSCYYVDAADQSQLKAFVKMYAIAFALVSFTGSMASLGFAEALALDHGYLLPEKIKLVLVVYLICSALFYVGPAVILWKVYRDAVTGLCGSLTVADPASVRSVATDSGRILWLALFAGAVLLLAVGLFLLAGRRHP